jgi:hypothetical protein
MSFFDSKGNPFGERFSIKFFIVSESQNLLEEIDEEILANLKYSDWEDE